MDLTNKIILGDCLDVMKDMPDNSVDCVITSPPYDNLRTYENNLDWSFDLFKDIAKELNRILKEGGVIVWIVGDATVNGSETGTSFKQALYFKEIGLRLHDTMIYKKECIFPDANRYLGVFEYMFIISKDKPKTVNFIFDRENKSASKKTGSTYRQKDGTTRNKVPKEIPKYGRRNNIWYYSTGFNKSTTYKDAFQHPAIFPEKLVADHITSWTNKNDIILDPFLGSGTTAVACIQTNRRYIGIEKEEKYYNIALKRVKEEEAKLKLF